ncbi:MrcB family domain-containing protein [Methanococcus maripaludis]|uniref:Putative lmo0304 n=1 Tax=Methanococcus maripaludis (strain DSM 14266 / JCM 13030 / NBRC 101832 / S2 / LL) TaxID=267377 RepID=Q6LZ70_METMP|nr:DUF3578 domain-containing protein [Methanococcus maripaludis]CAF30315.1 putative lmo0304 [Methanococcus maripaludis S2]
MSGDLQTSILKILNEYTKESENSFKDNQLMKYVLRDIPEIFENKAALDSNKYKIKASVGQGNWAEIPWICIFDKEVTETAQKGYYIVYLFKNDMSGVYLSLNQGWTQYSEKYGSKGAKLNIKKVSSVYKDILKSSSDFDFSEISLGKRTLAKGYELGHICGKYYSLSKFPEEKELINDLRNLIGVYRELKGNVNSYIKNKGISEYYDVIEMLLAKYEKEDFDISEEDGEGGLTLEKSEIPDKTEGFQNRNRTYSAVKTNFEHISKGSKKLGSSGEKLVYDYEVSFLNENGCPNLAKNVKHVSEEDGDGAGYDILSYDLKGNEKYIEVKTTKNGKNTPFIVSRNELEFSKEYGDKYYIYRVYEFNPKNKSGKFYVVNGPIDQEFNLEPKEYYVKR